MIRGNSFQELAEVPLPARTSSYTPVPHTELVQMIDGMCSASGFSVVDHRFELAANGHQLFGVYHIEAHDGSFRKALGFRNSYDKSIAVGLCAGSSVIVCSNLMFKGDVIMMRKHTGSCMTDIGDLVSRCFDVMDVEFEEIKEDAGRLQEIEMPRTKMAELAGRLFIEEDLFSSTQLNVMKREIIGSPLFKEQTAWDFYNHATEALKHCPPRERMGQHSLLHKRVLELAEL
jgi:hypothetical protein